MKKILFDSQIFDIQKYGGISRQYVNLSNFLEKDKYQCEFGIQGTRNVYLKNIDSKGLVSNRDYCIDLLKKGSFDVFYPTYFYTYFLEHIGNKPFIMSVHDMIPEMYNIDYDQINGKRELVKYASSIEVPTECTKKDLVRILDVPEEKIHVVGRSISSDFGKDCSDAHVEYEYILFVGNRWGYKNFNNFITYITPFMLRHKDIHIVCTGGEFQPHEKSLISRYGLTDRVHSCFVDDNTLAGLYKKALFFVFPSTNEGFGVPILESATMGCLTLLNNTDCFREIAGDKGIYFDLPLNCTKSNLSDIAEDVYSMTSDEKKNEIFKQQDVLKKYSKENYVSKYSEAIDAAMN